MISFGFSDNQEGLYFISTLSLSVKWKSIFFYRGARWLCFHFVVFHLKAQDTLISVCENMVYFMFRITVNGCLLQRRAMTFVFENKGSGAFSKDKNWNRRAFKCNRSSINKYCSLSMNLETPGIWTLKTDGADQIIGHRKVPILWRLNRAQTKPGNLFIWLSIKSCFHFEVMKKIGQWTF